MHSTVEAAVSSAGDVLQHVFLCGCSGCDSDRIEITNTTFDWTSKTSGFGSDVVGFGDAVEGGLTTLTDLASATPNFGFNVDVKDLAGGTSSTVLNLFKTIAEKAMGAWASFLDGVSGATLDVELNVGGSSAVASAGPGALYFGDSIDTNRSGRYDDGDFVQIVPGSLVELQTGRDPNGGAADIVINVNEQLVNSGSFFFDASVSNAVPSGKIDFFSVMLHEIAHGLGFSALNDNAGQFQQMTVTNASGQTARVDVGTMLDFYTTKDTSGKVVYSGPNGVKAYGDTIDIEFTTGSSGSDLSHFLGSHVSGQAPDLRYSLMNPFVVNGDRVEIGQLELAVLKDLGHKVTANAPVFTNYVDPTTTPVAKVGPNLNVSGTTLQFDVTLDRASPLTGASSSIAYEAIGTNGRTLTGRVLFTPGDTKETVTIDGSKLFGSSLSGLDGALKVELFNPTNLKLSNDSMSQSFSAGSGTTAAPEPTPEPEPEREPEPDPAPEPSPSPSPSGTGYDNVVTGSDSTETLRGTSQADLVVARGGHDFLYGYGGDDVLVGGEGADNLSGGDGRNLFIGGRADGTFDRLMTRIYAGSDENIVTHMEMTRAYEGRFFDTISGPGFKLETVEEVTAMANHLASDGDGSTKAVHAGDYLRLDFGGGQSLTFLYWDTHGADAGSMMNRVPESLPNNIASGLLSVSGSGSDDFLTGTNADEDLNGRGGDDFLMGSAGQDRLTGGTGRDSFAVGDSRDTITDFDLGSDQLVIYHQFTGYGSRHEDELSERGKQGLSSASEFLDLIKLMESDGTWNTDVSVSGSDLIMIFERDSAGQVVDGVRLEGFVGSEISATALYAAGADNPRSQDLAAFADFDG